MDHVDCPIRQVLDRFGDKWSILILCLLGSKGKLRFTEISSQISDMSQKMQTETLRSLEKDGLINRTLYAEIPPRVEYELTDSGKSLIPHIEGLANWALENREGISKSRNRYDMLEAKRLTGK